MLQFGENDPFTQVVLEETEGAGDNATASENRRVRDRLAALAERGERWAAAKLDECELAGIGSQVSRIAKQFNRTTVKSPSSDRLIDMPAIYGARIRDPLTGKKTTRWERSKWVQAEFDIALEISRDLIRDGGKQVARGEAIASIVVFARRACPDTKSIAEACDILGIDAEHLSEIFDIDLTGTDD